MPHIRNNAAPGIRRLGAVLPGATGMILCMAMGVTLAAGAAAETGPSFDCDMARTATEKRICGSPALAAMDQTVAARYTALQLDMQSKAARTGIVADQRAWLQDRDACADPDALETCLRDAYQRRHRQLDIHRSIFVGPAIPHPFRMKCQDTAATQLETAACLQQAVRGVDRTLAVAAEAAAAEKRELDKVTSAGIGAEQAFTQSQRAFESYRDAACRAVAASYAGGSGAGVAFLWCQRQVAWERANRIAADFLYCPFHWSRNLDALAAPIRACLAIVAKMGPGPRIDPRITAITESKDGGRVIHVATGETWTDECTTAPDGTVEAVIELDGTAAPPDPPLAVFYPAGSRIGPERREMPPDDPCSLYRWTETVNGDFAGWVRLALCR